MTRSTRSLLRTAALLAPAALLLRVAAAQTPLQTFNGGAAGDRLGYAVAGAGDTNNDGYDDVILGAPGADPAGLANAGTAYVRSGKDGTTLRTWSGIHAQDSFGSRVAGVGDVDLDGFDDVAVGAPEDSSIIIGHDGSVRVYSGQTGLVLLTLFGPQTGDSFGSAVASPGDWNADGHPDIAVGAPLYDATVGMSVLADAGLVNVYSGTTGLLIKNFTGVSGGENLGWSVAGAGDVDADGFTDLVIGAPELVTGSGNVGGAQVWSGQTKLLLFTGTGSVPFDQMGIGVAGAGDVNKDGFDDIIAGAYGEGGNAGAAHVFLGPLGAPSWIFHGTAANDRMGLGVAGVGDVNKDGYDDVMAGAYQTTAGAAGYARIWSGKDASLLYATLVGDGADDDFGAAVAAAGDTNADGWPDVLIGEPEHDGVGADAGRAFIDDVLVHQTKLGFQGPGNALLDVYGTPLATGGQADIHLTGCVPGKPAVLVASAALNPLPLKGGTLAPDITTALLTNFVVDIHGDVLLKSVKGGHGPLTVYLQFLAKDSTMPQGWEFSNAVAAHFLP